MPGSPKRARSAPSPAPAARPSRPSGAAVGGAPLKSPAETQAILARLYGQHPNATTELDFTTPFELLVATILSAQSSDKRVNEVTPALFKRYPDPRRLVAATAADLEPQIVATGFFRQKAKMLLGMAEALLAKHGGQVPADMDALTALPGVGRKTANVVLGHALGVPGFPVDRHVLRVTNRIGLVRSDDPEAVEAHLCSLLPPDIWTLASDTFILHGRRVCKPKPLCDRCAVRPHCDSFREAAAQEGTGRLARPGARTGKPPGTRKAPRRR
jgi:endonuclease III